MLWFYLGSFGFCFFFFKQKTAYEITHSDWSSDVCSSDLDKSVESCTAFGAWCARWTCCARNMRSENGSANSASIAATVHRGGGAVRVGRGRKLSIVRSADGIARAWGVELRAV